jgi:metal-responsive CopG/Arc/MetJ family transcriptional regulator
MKNSTVNISFKDDLLKAIDSVAAEESRSRSELIREAARQYIERKKRWEQIFSIGENQAREKDIQEEDVFKEIHDYREEKSNT